MKKRLLLALLLIVSVCATCFAFAGCKDEDNTSNNNSSTSSGSTDDVTNDGSTNNGGDVDDGSSENNEGGNGDDGTTDDGQDDDGSNIDDGTNDGTTDDNGNGDDGTNDGQDGNESDVLIGSVGLEYTLSNDSTYYTVTGIGDCTDTNLVIPSTYKGKPVTSIGSYAFEDCSSLTSIEIPDSVTSIGYSAFKNCSSLTNVTIGDGVTSIGDDAFNGCSNLTYNEYDNAYYLGNETNKYVTLIKAKDTSITSCTINDNTKFIHSIAFAFCYSLTSIEIPNSVKSIGYCSFGECVSLTNVTIGNNVTSIEMGAFCECISLKNINIPDGVVNIGYGAFYACINLMSIKIPNSVKTIGAEAFCECYKLVEVYNLSSLPITIDSRAYGYVGYYAKVIHTDITEQSILTTDDDGFITFSDNGVKTLIGYVGTETEITIPNSVTSIGSSAFRGCRSLTSVTIPNSVTSIGWDAFYYCDSLTYNEYDNGYYLGNEENKYLALIKAKDTSITSCTINDNTKVIADSAFRNCSSLTNVTIGDSVTSICYGAFEYCSSLTNVIIGDGVISIGNYAFAHCSKLTSIEIPNSVTSIGYSAFEYCSSLTKVNYTGTIDQWVQIDFGSSSSNPLYYAKNLYINDELVTEANITTATTINDYAFYKCSSLTNVTIGDSVTSIGERAFYNCSSLTSIEIPNSVTSIGDYAFDYCSKLTKVNYTGTIDQWVQIDFGRSSSNPLDYAKKLYINDVLVTEVNITAATFINKYAFYNCSSLTSVTIGDNVTSIGNWAFRNCSSLTNVTIGDSVTSIGYDAFSRCSSLTYNEYDNGYYLGNEENKYLALIKAKDTSITSCTINDNTKFIHSNAYNNCSSLTSVIIGDNVTSIGQEAFSYCSSLTSITVDENNQYYKSTDGNLYNKDGTRLIQYAIGKKDASFILPEVVTSIAPYAFYNCRNLTSVTIGDNVTSIPSCAFRGCSSLTSVTIGDSVTSIGSYAFEDCSSLTSIEIPNSVTSIGDYAFEDCSSLTSIEIPNSVTSIGDYAFYRCYKLIEVYNLSSLSIEHDSNDNSFVGDYAKVIHTDITEQSILTTDDDGFITFSDNGVKTLIGYVGAETEITIPSDVESIYQYAFSACISLTSIEIPNSVTSIGSDAFNGCSAEIIWGDNPTITSIGVRAFYGYKGTSVTIPNSVISIGSYAFEDCSNLTNVTIGDSVTSIGYSAFDSCWRLTNVYYKGNADDWANISIGSYNTYLTNAMRYYYIEKEADVPTDGGNYWHYVDGVPTVWVKE